MDKLTALLLLMVAAPVLATDEPQQSFESGPQRVNLVELFTSEGCSSCPPADRWLRDFTDHPQLWQRVIPVAFHVDYWDYLGWQDPFASRSHSQRQRRYAEEGLASGVYTPGLFVNGREWRGFFSRREVPLVDTPAPQLKATVDGDQVTIALSGTNPLVRPQAHVAILGFGLQTQVPRGENRGRRLAHDFVVLGMERGLLADDSSGYKATLRLPLSRRPSQREAIAVWVSDGDQAPLQAVGGWLASSAP